MYVCMYVYRRPFCVQDLKFMYVCMYVGMYVCCAPNRTIFHHKLHARLLTAVQYIHRQRRCITVHVEFEDRDWMNAFNLFLSLSALFEHLFAWFSSESSIKPLETKVTSATKLAPR